MTRKKSALMDVIRLSFSLQPPPRSDGFQMRYTFNRFVKKYRFFERGWLKIPID